jgi:hypothetical protein
MARMEMDIDEDAGLKSTGVEMATVMRAAGQWELIGHWHRRTQRPLVERVELQHSGSRGERSPPPHTAPESTVRGRR